MVVFYYSRVMAILLLLICKIIRDASSFEIRRLDLLARDSAVLESQATSVATLLSNAFDSKGPFRWKALSVYNHAAKIKQRAATLSPHAMLLVCEEDAVVGYCEVGLSQASLSDQRVPLIGNLVVDPAFRNKGYGSKLVKMAETVVTEEWGAGRYNTIFVAVEEGNIPAESLYRGLGYKMEEEQVEKSISHKDGMFTGLGAARLQLGKQRTRVVLAKALG